MDQSREKTIIKDFAQRLKKIRLQRKLSLRQLADAADMNFGNIHEMEKGNINPSLTTVVFLAEALQVEIKDLVK
ncbi:MAG: helix-turn-helix transcriptional regulator [Bacteroidota bacterium]|nr:helix-turn-helix transcriptional regulator [Bacteroidota bacterium]